MAPPNPISNLADVEEWLSDLVLNEPTDISPGMFSAPMVVQTLELLPGANPIALTPTLIDAPAATLKGTATMLNEPGTNVVFVFSEVTTTEPVLVCTITVTPPPTLTWKLIEALKLTVDGLSATLTPNPDLAVTAMAFTATLETTTSPALELPVEMLAPSFEGDWTLATTRELSLGDLTEAALSALAGGQDVMGILPAGLKDDPKKLVLTHFAMQFNLKDQTCASLQLGMRYDGDWKFLDGKFVVQSVTFDVDVFRPFSSNVGFDAKLYATMQLPPLPSFDVGGQFPDAAVFARLTPGQTLQLTAVFAYFGLPLPTGMPDVEISTLGFTLHPSDGAFRFDLEITKPIVIYEDKVSHNTVSLDTFLFDIGATYDLLTKELLGQGGLYAHFTIGHENPTTMSIGGTYVQGKGLDLIGQASNVPLGELVGYLAAKFGIQESDIPNPILRLMLDAVRVELNTGTTTFDFSCIAATKISGADVEFVPKIHVNYGGTAPEKKFDGGLTLHAKQPDGTIKDLIFTLEFSTTPADTWIKAQMVATGTGVSFQDLASVFNVTLPPIPPDLDLGLTGLGFRYDFKETEKTLTFWAASNNYGSVVFVAGPIPRANGPQEYVFLLNADVTFSLSNLPLVGQELARIEDVSVNKLGVAISTMDKIDGPTAAVINQQISDAGLGADYPRLPEKGISGRILITADLVLGTETLPLSVSVLGGASTAKLLPADAGAAPMLMGAAGDGGVTWFNVQRSFGPVSIARIGVLYQSETQTLWFELDATLKFGPLTLTLQGLGVGSPISDFVPQFNLQGLGVAYSAPPLTIAGALINLVPPGGSGVEFAGAVMISTGEFTVQAFGYYGRKNYGTGEFTSMFLFGDLLYPFGGPPALFVTGVALGFGYNSGLQIPTIDQVQIFPFVQVLANPDFFGPNPTPTDALSKMINSGPSAGVPWVGALNNSLWFAAGITFTSFELVNSVAMVFVEAGADLVIALIGVSRAQFPQSGGGKLDERLYALIEMDLLLRFAPQEGVFSLEAVLAAGSFLLDRACVLMGGFAFYVWYSPSAHAGDFVVTLGGYHPGFTPPPYYPQVPRVGFHWSVDSSITISGGTYFAFTPAALMVGGALNATYQSGNLKAWFNAHADIIVRWKPFWFDAEIGIVIGASYTMDFLGISKTFSLELGVDLGLWGPPTGGRVHVNWYIISFTVSFGYDPEAGQQIKGWDDGVQPMLPNTGSDSEPNVLSITPTAGLTPTGTGPGTSNVRGDEPDTASWLVRATQFGFAIDSPIPATTIKVGNQQFAGRTFNVYPLGWKVVSATQTITVLNEGQDDYSDRFELTAPVKSVSSALWGAPPQTGSGKPAVPDGKQLLVPDQKTGITALVKPATVGSSAGPVYVRYLAYDELNKPGAVVPLSANAKPEGVVPVASNQTVADIANPGSGIGADSTQEHRGTILAALTALHLNPDTRNDSMTEFARRVSCLLSDQPLLVEQLQRNAP